MLSDFDTYRARYQRALDNKRVARYDLEKRKFNLRQVIAAEM
jgi:hypothetical protein